MIVKANKNDTEALKMFALMMAWAFPLFFAGLLPWLFSYSWHWWPLLVSAYFIATYAVIPSLIYYPYIIWMTVAGALGWFNSRVILAVTFYLLIWPIGLLLRLTNKLDFDLKANKKDSNYKMPEKNKDKNRLEHPF